MSNKNKSHAYNMEVSNEKYKKGVRLVTNTNIQGLNDEE